MANLHICIHELLQARLGAANHQLNATIGQLRILGEIDMGVDTQKRGGKPCGNGLPHLFGYQD